MGKGKAKYNKSVNKKAKKNKSDLWKQTVLETAASLRKRWSSCDEPVRTNKLRSKDGYSLRSNPVEEQPRSKKKDNSYSLRSGKSNCSSTVQSISKRQREEDRIIKDRLQKMEAEPAAAFHASIKKKFNRERKIRRKQLRLQKSAIHLEKASPWLEAQPVASDQTNDNDDSTEQRSVKLPRSGLPTDNIHTETLSQELLAFAAYVQLTPEEQNARQALVQSLQEVAAKQQQEVRVFGSYATPQVCAFMSDIDIALWGAIPDPPTTVAKADPPAPTPAQLQQERKRKRLELWKEALAQVDAANETVPDAVRHASVGSLQEALSSTKSEDSSPSFVIDRVGSFAETSKTDIPNPVATTTHMSASHDSSDSDDSADKMESFQPTSSSRTRQPNYSRYVSLSSESSDDESVLEEEDNEKINNMQVSFFTAPPLVSAGPKGRIRNKVLDALGSFREEIRRMSSKWIVKVNFITKARVPILKMNSALGVEVDVAVGGHNGADTSHFAAQQSNLYKRYVFVHACLFCMRVRRARLINSLFFSFSTVVLFLKAFLHQHELDVPFTGGLGSFKLYVLVAFHIQQHLLAGGRDEPGEVLLAFFFRYGDIDGYNDVPRQCRTTLKQHEPLYYNDDTIADLSNVFHLESCKELFRRSWTHLWKIMATARNSNQPVPSLLRHIIDGHQMSSQRASWQRRSAQAVEKLLRKKRQSSDDARESSAKRLRIS